MSEHDGTSGKSGQDTGDWQEEGGWFEAFKRRSAVPIGVIGLFAWFALLWFMFGDVL
ncbi:hypothetical protein PX699_04485 [Sphingobium sp. H39-3-25]|uniref:hypothetical protein n=1 Tax=Sphingobium arseniciresistens TaxID=3030834 RepID=UPI0023B94AC4|nr:hypothetical protein [Sphingobium arseniciresistens]